MTQFKLYGIFILLSVVILGVGLCLGSISIPISHWAHLSPVEAQILFQIRLPRLLTAFLVGACLASAGAAFQGILQNPLADPYVLGVSAGAGLGACLSMLVGIAFMTPFILPLSTFLGGYATILLVFAIVKKTKGYSITEFILSGIMINAFFSSFTLLLLVIADAKLRGMMLWLMGDLSHTDSFTLYGLYAIAVGTLVLLMKNAYKLNLIAIGDENAQALGLPVSRFRTKIFFYASTLTGIAIAGGGIIGFIGLVVPHCLRLIFKNDFRQLIPLSFLLGGIFLMTIDTLTRVLTPDSELPVGVLTSLLGAPFFLWLLVKKR